MKACTDPIQDHNLVALSWNVDRMAKGSLEALLERVREVKPNWDALLIQEAGCLLHDETAVEEAMVDVYVSLSGDEAILWRRGKMESGGQLILGSGSSGGDRK